MSSFLPEQWRELEERMREIVHEEINLASHFAIEDVLAETPSLVRDYLLRPEAGADQTGAQSPQGPVGTAHGQ